MSRNRLRGNMKEYDDYFSEFFELEKRKIPGIFKFLNTKKRCMTVLITAAVLIVMILALMPLYYSSMDPGSVETLPGRTLYFATYDNRILAIQIVLGVLAVILLLWIELSWLFEKKAFKDATVTASLAERRRVEKEWDNRGNRYTGY